MNRLNGILLAVLLGVLLCGLSYTHGVKIGKTRAEGGIKERVDTLYCFDTISVPTPVYLEREVVRTDTLLLVDTRTDTIRVPVALPIERRVYAQDSLYRAVVSGYLPSLDTIEVYPKTELIERTIIQEKKVRSRWGVGVQAGYGVGGGGVSPYIGIGVSYNLLSF